MSDPYVRLLMDLLITGSFLNLEHYNRAIDLVCFAQTDENVSEELRREIECCRKPAESGMPNRLALC